MPRYARTPFVIFTAAHIKILDWDSAFFGFPVASLSSMDAGEIDPDGLRAELRARGIQLAYWSGATAPSAAQHERLLAAGGRLVDEKVTYAIPLTHPHPAHAVVPAGMTIESVPPGRSTPALTELAIQASHLSRFAVDPGTQSKVAALYTIWMDRSVSRELALDVLVAASEAGPAGMITLGERGGRGDIGLVAVGSAWRGRRIGELLVHAALRELACRGHASAQVVTQAANASARRLYEKCGFALESTQFVYHIWP